MTSANKLTASVKSLPYLANPLISHRYALAIDRSCHVGWPTGYPDRPIKF